MPTSRRHIQPALGRLARRLVDPPAGFLAALVIGVSLAAADPARPSEEVPFAPIPATEESDATSPAPVLEQEAAGRDKPQEEIAARPKPQSRALPREVVGPPLVPSSAWTQSGQASWYGPYFHGRKTASGEIFDASARTVAHPTLPLGCVVAVENLDNGRRAVARVNDRGPFRPGRIVDCSYSLAHELGFVGSGVASVRVTLLDSIGAEQHFAGRGVLVALSEADREPLERYAAYFSSGKRGPRPFVGPPAPPVDLLAELPTSPAIQERTVRRASVLEISAFARVARSVVDALFGPIPEVHLEVGFPARPERFGLREFAALFTR
jgi:rare lipoprotein A (peptidoglycan hydrolase)